MQLSQNPFNQNNSSNETKTDNFISNIKIEHYQKQVQKLELNNQEFIRTSSENIPNNEYLIRNTGIPFGLNITPFPDIDSTLISQYSFGGGNGDARRCRGVLGGGLQLAVDGGNSFCNGGAGGILPGPAPEPVQVYPVVKARDAVVILVGRLAVAGLHELGVPFQIGGGKIGVQVFIRAHHDDLGAFGHAVL